ncbi:MAG: ammonium transporter [Myxococcota bacterium]
MDVSLADSLWVLLCAFLVFFMHAGFALLESGLCRRKNAVAVLMKNFGVVATASIAFFALGYGLMFGEGTLAGTGPFAPDDASAQVGSLPLLVHMFFQLVFAATACTIVSGAVAERSKLGPFLFFTAVATAFIYPLVGKAVWGGGLLALRGFADFAGSTAVHLVGGAMALAGAQVVGARKGKFDGAARPMRAHNLPLAALGVMVLWLGWFGFNGGSTLSASDPGAIAKIVLVTNLAAAAGFLAALAYTHRRTGVLDFSMALNGALAGLVSITAGCDQIAALPALAIGAVGAVLCVESVLLLERRKIDDPVGAVSVHGACGAFGTLAVGLVGSEGLFYGKGADQLLVQLLGVVSVAAFAYLSSLVVWKALATFVGVRVLESHEDEGLDLAECGAAAYGDELAGTSMG